MENHPIPQDITGFQFKLIGKMTIKQFVYLAIGAVIAWLVFFILNFPAFIKWPVAIISFTLGAMIAFVPIDGRPMDLMLKNFFRALLSPTQFIYQKTGVKLPDDTLPNPNEVKNHHFSGLRHSPSHAKTNSDLPTLENHKVIELATPIVEQQPTPAPAMPISQPTVVVAQPTMDLPTPTPPAVTAASQDPQIASAPQQIVLPPVYHNPPAPISMTIDDSDESKEIKKKEKELREAEEEREKMRQEMEELKKQLDEAIKEKEKALSAPPPTPVVPPPPPTPTAEQLNAQNLEKQLIEATRAREALEKQLIEERSKAQAPQQTVIPALTQPAPAPQPTQRVRSVPPGMEKSVGIPSIPEFPNLITGIVKDPRNNPLQNILIEVKDEDSNPVRAFKTNGLGKFASATSLSNGKYVITFEDPKETHKFDAVEVELVGAPVMPLEIISVDPREELRRELFK